jgi:hypothetical protein
MQKQISRKINMSAKQQQQFATKKSSMSFDNSAYEAGAEPRDSRELAVNLDTSDKTVTFGRNTRNKSERNESEQKLRGRVELSHEIRLTRRQKLFVLVATAFLMFLLGWHFLTEDVIAMTRSGSDDNVEEIEEKGDINATTVETPTSGP